MPNRIQTVTNAKRGVTNSQIFNRNVISFKIKCVVVKWHGRT